ncbi:MAG TPA: hypothetical protein VNO24_17720 [Blastocatellia bacterium]|nr:hypothetical protein [Blastocatellia bacterium]
MRTYFVAFVLTAGCALGCCFNGSAHTEAAYPNVELGWKDFGSNSGGAVIRGRFVVRKGETTDNGKIQIKVLELISPDRCAEAGAINAQARVRFQFVRSSDHKVLCEDIFPEHGGVNIEPCGAMVAELGVGGIWVSAVSLKEEWAFFEVR